MYGWALGAWALLGPIGPWGPIGSWGPIGPWGPGPLGTRALGAQAHGPRDKVL